MREFNDGETITIEPFRARSFPIVKDLVVDRSALDRIVQAGGFVSARTGSAPEANSIPVPKHNADLAMEAAACIGAARARQPARMDRQCFSPLQKSRTFLFCHRAHRNVSDAC